MSEPITLYDAKGKEIVVHGHNQAAALVAAGGVFYTAPATPEPGDAAVTEPVTEDAPPGDDAKTVVKKTAPRGRG